MQNKAKRRLSFYFRTIFEGLGWKWERDNQSEIEELIDMLMGEEEETTSYAEYKQRYPNRD